jgi:hypothetical protein
LSLASGATALGSVMGSDLLIYQTDPTTQTRRVVGQFSVRKLQLVVAPRQTKVCRTISSKLTHYLVKQTYAKIARVMYHSFHFVGKAKPA